MRFIRLIFVVVSLILILSCSSAQTKKANFFPLIGINTDRYTYENYSNQLLEKFNKTEVFELREVTDFKPALSDPEMVYQDIKEGVKIYCKKKDLKSAIFGYIKKVRRLYEVYIELYSVKEDNVISRYTDSFRIDDEMEFSTKKCAVQFASRVNNINVANVTFNAALIPGLGLAKMKSYTRAAVYFGTALGLLIKHRQLQKDLIPINEDKFTFISQGFNQKYYIDGISVPREEWYEKRSIWAVELEEFAKHNEKIKTQQKVIGLGIVLVYVINVIDTALEAGKRNNVVRIEEKLGYDFDLFNNQPSIRFKYHF